MSQYSLLISKKNEINQLIKQVQQANLTLASLAENAMTMMLTMTVAIPTVLIEECTANIKVCKARLSELKVLVKRCPAQEQDIYRNHYIVVYNKFIAVVKDHQNKKMLVTDAIKQNIRHKAQLCSVTDRGIDVFVVVDQTLVSGEKPCETETVTHMYNNIQQREREVQELAQSIREVYDMFSDFSLLVQSQHEAIGKIDVLAGEAEDAVQSGNDELYKAQQAQIRARKRCCCCILIVGIGLILGLSLSLSLGFGLM